MDGVQDPEVDPCNQIVQGPHETRLRRNVITLQIRLIDNREPGTRPHKSGTNETYNQARTNFQEAAALHAFLILMRFTCLWNLSHCHLALSKQAETKEQEPEQPEGFAQHREHIQYTRGPIEARLDRQERIEHPHQRT